MPVVNYAPSSGVAKDYMALAEELIAETAEMDLPVGLPVVFSFLAPQAEDVRVVGDFNGWKYESGLRLSRGKNGVWRQEVRLRPGKYQYKFIVDGEWVIDPENQNVVENPFGSKNSLLVVPPPNNETTH